jgi:hypothetical protein
VKDLSIELFGAFQNCHDDRINLLGAHGAEHWCHYLTWEMELKDHFGNWQAMEDPILHPN